MNKEVNIYFKVEGLDGYITDLDQLKSALNEVDTATKSAETATRKLQDSVEDFDEFESKLELMEGSVKTLAGSFEILAGSAALLGLEDNEFFQELEENVIGVIALAEGAINVSEGLKLLAQNQKLAAVAQRIFNAAANANPYVLLASAILAAGAAIIAFTQNTNSNTRAVEDNTEEIKKQNEELDKQIEREEKLAELRGEDVFELRLQRAKDEVESLKEQRDALSEISDAFIEIPVDVLDPTKGTRRIYQADADQAELDRINAALVEAQANLTALEEEAAARNEGRLKRENEQAEAAAREERRRRVEQREAAEDELYLLSLSAQEREETLAMQRFDARIALGVDEKAAEEQLLRDLQEINDRYAAEAEAKTQEQLAKDLAIKQEYATREEMAYIALNEAKANAARAGFGVLESLAGDNEKLADAIFVAQQAFEAGRIFTKARADIAESRSNTAKEVGMLSTRAAAGDLIAAGLIGPTIAAGTSTVQALRLNAAAGIAGILATSITRFKGKGGGGNVDSGGGGGSNPGVAINYSFGQQAGQTIGVGQASTGQQAPVQTYVLASDVTSAQQAQQQINNLSRL